MKQTVSEKGGFVAVDSTGVDEEVGDDERCKYDDYVHTKKRMTIKRGPSGSRPRLCAPRLPTRPTRLPK